MKAALDVHYEDDRAIAACVIFHTWQDSTPAKLLRTSVPAPKRYRAGRFYERELPALLSVLESAGQALETLIIDGFVHLKPDLGRGLGAHLFDALPYPTTVIGVAKNPLKLADRYTPILRGRSKKPLYVSAIGLTLDNAARAIGSMHGPFRVPTLLKIADEHSRGAYNPPGATRASRLNHQET